MAAQSSTAMDLLVGGLRNISVLAAGEALNATDAADALQVLNDLLDSLSTDKQFVPFAVENILAWTPGKYQYTVGNPTSATTFTGNLTAASNVITGVTIPSNLILKGDITDSSASLPANTTITAISTNTVTLSANAVSTVAGDLFTYTTPGDFKIPRPLRIRDGFTRITSSGNTGLDYLFKSESLQDYVEIGYKGVPGPWPLRVAYQPTMPLGTLFCYPNPQQAGELHLWTDGILSDLTTVNQVFTLPQGYARALKKLLAIELAPEYGKTPSMELRRQAEEARTFIRSMNETPIKMLNYDAALWNANRNDASWIMDGGFNRG